VGELLSSRRQIVGGIVGDKVIVTAREIRVGELQEFIKKFRGRRSSNRTMWKLNRGFV
jgi:hypothetical protein